MRREGKLISQQLQPGHQTAPLDAVGLLRAQVLEVHRALEECLDAWLRAVVPASPPAGSPHVGLYVHAATVEDLVIHSLLRGVPPLFETTWQGRGPADFSTLNVEPVRSYARDVFAATDAYLEPLTPILASQTIDLSGMGLGEPTVAWVVSRFVVLELCGILGELRCALSRPGVSA